MSYATNDADVTGPRVDAAPRQSNVLRHGESWRSDELLSQPPKTYLGLGGSFCCALVLRIVVLILAVVALVLCIVALTAKFYYEAATVRGHEYESSYLLFGSINGVVSDYWYSLRKGDAWTLSAVSVLLIIGVVLNVISLAMAITYLVLLRVHHSARVRDDEEAHRQYRARTQKLEDVDAEMREMNGTKTGAAPRSSAHRRAAEDRLRREAHDDAARLYERERKRRHADRGVWFTLLFALLATFILLLAGFIVAVVVYNNTFSQPSDAPVYPEVTSRMCEGVWLTLASWIIALVGFVVCVLRPCIRGQQETLTAPPAYSDMPHSQDLPTPSTRRGEFELYRDEHSPNEMPKSSAIVTGVPMQPSAPQAGGEDKLHSPPAAEHYATYYRE